MDRRRKGGDPPALAKRLRRSQLPSDNVSSTASSVSAATVLVSGLPDGCSVMELKSRLEIYGPISRTRVDAADRSALVTFRSDDAASAAISAAADAAVGVSIRSQVVEIRKVTDPLSQWRIAVKASPSSRLLRAELPLRRHGRSNKKLDTSTTSTTDQSNRSNLPYEGRQIVAYDDIF